MKYSSKLLLANCIPVVVFAIISMIYGFTQFRSSLYVEKEGHLKSTALAALALYSSHGYGDYGRKDDSNVWRGMNFNVSKETSIVDELKDQTKVDITFFFDDMPEMTSIADDKGNRFVETSAIDSIRQYTLWQGAQLWCKNIKINGKTCQAYVIPIRQSSNNYVVGALMASQSAKSFNDNIRNYVLTTIVLMIVVFWGAFGFIRWYVNHFSQEFYEVTNKSKRDLLTNLYNKRTFEDEVQKALQTKDENEIAVLLIFDFDNFKYINDNYGHQTGDEVLQSFAHILVRAFRTNDIIGRIGGDEFMVFMTGMTENALQRADEISQEVLHELDILKVDKAEHFSCSIGIGTSAENLDFKALYLLADKALYEAKERGKACYVRISS